MRDSTLRWLSTLCSSHSEQEVLEFLTDIKKAAKRELVAYVHSRFGRVASPKKRARKRQGHFGIGEATPTSRIATLVLDEGALDRKTAVAKLGDKIEQLTGRQAPSAKGLKFEAWVRSLLKTFEPSTVMRAAMEVRYGRSESR
jgi:hypothetical protein